MIYDLQMASDLNMTSDLKMTSADGNCDLQAAFLRLQLLFNCGFPYEEITVVVAYILYVPKRRQ